MRATIPPQRSIRPSVHLVLKVPSASVVAQVCLDYRPVNTKTVEPDNPPVPPAKRVY